MSNNQNTYIVLPGGKECKAVNPHPFPKHGKPGDFSVKQYDDFELYNYPIPLTEVMPEGETFSGVWAFWGYKEEDINEWLICTNNDPDLAKALGYKVAIKPLKAIEPVKDNEVTQMEKDVCKKCGELFFHCSCNSAIVDVVENKETVEGVRFFKDIHNEIKNRLAPEEEQSQSIEGIVGFVLEWVANDERFTLFSDVHTQAAILNMKSDIIKEVKK